MVACGFPYIKDVPDELELGYIETPRAEGPFGAAGCGELPLTAPHASIINGIYNACGVRITHLPARPEKVLAGLRELSSPK
jgi:aldehyde oxidoreductase